MEDPPYSNIYQLYTLYSGPRFVYFSCFKAFINDTIASIITNIKGNAAATDAVCNASSPPASNKEVANKA